MTTKSTLEHKSEQQAEQKIDKQMMDTGCLAGISENKLRAAEYAKQITSGLTPSKLSELNYLEDLYERKDLIAKRAEEKYRRAKQAVEEKRSEHKALEHKIQTALEAHDIEVRHLGQVQKTLSYEAELAINMAAQKKRDEKRARENINKAIISHQTLINHLENSKKTNYAELEKAEKHILKAEKEARSQRDAANKAQSNALHLKQRMESN